MPYDSDVDSQSKIKKKKVTFFYLLLGIIIEVDTNVGFGHAKIIGVRSVPVSRRQY
jgi:hypothetical protein